MGECGICEESFNQTDDTVTTECYHTFHRACAKNRLNSTNKSDCRICHKEFALQEALDRSNNISSGGECSICESPWISEHEIVVTECNHTFHYECARNRFEKKNRTDCHFCHQESALGDALNIYNKSQFGECSICEEKWSRRDDVITTRCQHTFHYECARNRFEKKNRTDCHFCHQESALGDALSASVTKLKNPKRNEENQSINSQRELTKDEGSTKSIEDNPRSKQNPIFEAPNLYSNTNKILPTVDDYRGNLSMDTRSTPMITTRNYGEHLSNSQFTDSLYSINYDSFAGNPSNPIDYEKEKRTSIHVVYMCFSELPSNITTVNELEDLVTTRLQTVNQIKPIHIQCYHELMVGYIHVQDEKTKFRLTEDIKQLSLSGTNNRCFASFSDQIEIISYVVVSNPIENVETSPPVSSEILSKWMELYPGKKPVSCEKLNVQFPNIYRIVTNSFDNIQSIAQTPLFAINQLFARVYISASCNYFEDLPKSVTVDQLSKVIQEAIRIEIEEFSNIHVELNKKTRNACIISSGKIRNYLLNDRRFKLDDKIIWLQESLPHFLILHPISDTYNGNEILREKIFQGHAKVIQKPPGKLVIEISDQKVYDNCLNVGVLSIGNNQRVFIELYTPTINPEDHDIDDDTWYRQEMPNSEANVLSFINKLDRPIFHHKWNSQIWREKFQASKNRTQANSTDSKHYSKLSNDQIRHLLQVTVMLNTIGVIRKKTYSINNKQITLNLDPQMKTIVYSHQSLLQSGHSIKFIKTPFTSTKVEVRNQDCVDVYQDCLRNYKKPLILNMANATSPGGGYLKGDGAQEENLFRRSDYFRSLDIKLDHIQEQDIHRFECSADGHIQPLQDMTNMYPMDEFGAIYTSDLTFFRKSEDQGYEYMETPLQGVHALAVAAYRNPKLDGNLLSGKYAVGTRKKIENLFSIAFHNKHDCLVLSALGCGAFRNPPNHVAKLFGSVIEQYAGFFEKIIFAVIDDHNSNENMKVFQDELNGMSVEPSYPVNKPNTVSGPYRFSSDGSSIDDVRIFDAQPCQYGAKCSQLYDSNHSAQYSHPSLCKQRDSKDDCPQSDDLIHMLSFIHRKPCKNGALCVEIDNDRHSKEFEHPQYCSEKAKCEDTSEGHEKAYRHLPLCPDGKKCLEYQKRNQNHCERLRHCLTRCKFGNHCPSFHDALHINEFTHPFPEPCPLTPYNCSLQDEYDNAKEPDSLPHKIIDHCLTKSHVCVFGQNCTNQDELHREKWIHIPRDVCEEDMLCKKLTQEDHLNSFTHSNIRDIRLLCKYADSCRDRGNQQHVSRFRHVVKHENSGVVQCFNLNGGINFVENHRRNIDLVNAYIRKEHWSFSRSKSIPAEIIDWIKNVQPVHRCRPEIFESILLHGHVMSREYMEKLKDPAFVTTSVLQHSELVKIKYIKHTTYSNLTREFVEALVNQEFEKSESSKISSETTANPAVESTKSYIKQFNQTINKKKQSLLQLMNENDIKTIHEKAIEVAQASIKLHSNPAGIGYERDKDLETNKTVFAVLGPHLGHYYGDVFIVFKRDILHHPDSNYSIQAGTSYASGNCFKWRPWLSDTKMSDDEKIKLFHQTKLHASIPGYEYATALELIASTSHDLKRKSMDINLETIMENWQNRDSHMNIEAHLPQLIPLDYIDHIYVSQNLFDSLSVNAQKLLNTSFKHRITKTHHELELKVSNGPFGTKPEQKDRAEYQSFVVKEIMKKFDRSNKDFISGLVVTIPSTNFTEHYLVPMTIKQSDEKSRIDNRSTTNDDTVYIYWQTMNGDMILTISDELMDGGTRGTRDRCLLTCYLAPKPSQTTEQYHEEPSYLNEGGPFQPDIVVKERKYKVKSSHFYVGCNTDDFMTFCLEIQLSKGIVSLSHAGPNAIYNQAKMIAQFSRNELDLKQLNFVYITAGSHSISIRNLFITHEKQMNLHPKLVENYHKPGFVKTFSNQKTDSLKQPELDSSSQVKVQQEPGLFTRATNFLFGSSNTKLDPCEKSIYCTLQYSDDAQKHNEKYSHPCRYSELCRDKEPHLTHDVHQVPVCDDDGHCKQLTNPLHRSQYRHKGLSDYLIPCFHQEKCAKRHDGHHCKLYFHGERVIEPTSRHLDKVSPLEIQKVDNIRTRIPCKHGSNCYDRDPRHRSRYTHP